MTKIIYHSADLDGHCSGALIKYFVRDGELMPMNHGWPFPWDKITQGETIYMADFTLPIADMIRLASLADLTWIDHHKSAIIAHDESGLKLKGLRSVEHSGCELVWMFFKPNLALPRFVYLLGRYDVWDHQDPDVIPFQYGMQAAATDPVKNMPFWELLLTRPIAVKQFIQNGKIIVSYIDQHNEAYCNSYAFETEIDGLKAIACNRGVTGSKLFDSIEDVNTKYQVKITFCLGKDGYWKVSLYSTTIDVSIVAKKYGGGGHRGAAGFQCKELPFKY